MDFQTGVNYLFGSNGSGKTSVLDAIHYLCMGKSFIHRSDNWSVRHNSNFFHIKGIFQSSQTVELTYRLGSTKVMSYNGMPSSRLADCIGRHTVVVMAPGDLHLVYDARERRRWLDRLIGQVDPCYLQQLMEYNRLLHQRNALLRQMADDGQHDAALIEAINERLLLPAQYICRQRQHTLDQLAPLFNACFKRLTLTKEEATFQYVSTCAQADLARVWSASWPQDMKVRHTTQGIHRDDVAFFLNKYPLRHYSSQGQIKSFLIALKLGQYELMRARKGTPPLLLIDDFFDKLDAQRAHRLLTQLTSDGFPQIFLSHTQTLPVDDPFNGHPRIFYFRIDAEVPQPSAAHKE